jgi:uncharacterized protein
VTQRPAEIDPTILSQCNTVFALRMSNDRDQAIVSSAVSDTGSGLLEFLPALGQREAIAFGDGVALPVRIKFDELAKHNLPRSSTARFSEKWQKPVGDENFLEQVVERWRASGSGAGGDPNAQMAMFAEAMGLGAPNEADITAALAPIAASQPARAEVPSFSLPVAEERPALRMREIAEAPATRPQNLSGTQNPAGGPPQPSVRAGAGSLLRREPAAPASASASARRDTAAPAVDSGVVKPGSLQSLRDRLMSRTPTGR